MSLTDLRRIVTVLKPLGRKSTLAASTCVIALSIIAAHPVSASPTYAYLTTLAVPGPITPGVTPSAAPFSQYDLATFDSATSLYYLTDRSNNGIDVYSAKTNSFVERIGQGVFAGVSTGSSTAGPNGISISNVGAGKLLLAGDGPSTVVSFNLDSSGLNVVGLPHSYPTNGAQSVASAKRVDGVAYAPATATFPSGTILAANNAANPGFITLLNNADGSIVKSIKLNGSAPGIPNVAGQGVEATIYNTVRKTFFVAVPALNTTPAGDPIGAGGVIEVDPTTGSILNTYDFTPLLPVGTVCSPTGVAQGSGAAMFVACSDTAIGQSIILDPTGKGSIKLVNGISGGDQAYYDPNNNTFFEASRFQVGGPVLGVIDATSLALQTIPIGTNDHSVAVDPVTGEAFVATGPTTNIPNCSIGCIGVFAPVPVPEPATLPVLAVALTALGLLVRRRRRS